MLLGFLPVISITEQRLWWPRAAISCLVSFTIAPSGSFQIPFLPIQWLWHTDSVSS